jgi:hypothetical protein
MGSVNLDNTGSGSAVTLSSDGTSLLLDGTAIGGSPDLYAENYDGTSGLPSATGTNAVAIGVNASAGGVHSFVAGRNATDNSNQDAVVIGRFASASANETVAIGEQSDANGLRSVALGYVADANGSNSISVGTSSRAASQYSIGIGADVQANSDYSTAIGYGSGGSKPARTAGNGAMALGGSYASGVDSFAAVITNNTSSYGATGANSVAIGYQAKATQTYAATLAGFRGQATNSGATSVGGFDNIASGIYSVALGGRSNTSNGQYSYALGYGAHTQGVNRRVAFAGNGVSGETQSGWFSLGRTTSDATPIALTTDVNGTPSTTNQVILPNNSAYSFSGTIIAREQASAGSDYASWEIKGALLRDANAASTVLGNGIQNKMYATSGASAWAIALTADTTNGGLKIEVTGAASTNIRWVATVNTSEVTY